MYIHLNFLLPLSPQHPKRIKQITINGKKTLALVVLYLFLFLSGAACRLYFDLEFKTEFNQEKDGMKMVDIFIKVHY